MNMDQIPVYFSIYPNKRIEVCRKNVINLQTSTDNTKICSMAVTITASGHKLPLLAIFKARDRERLQKRTAHVQNGPAYACQDNTWLHWEVMLLFVNQALKPFLLTAPSDVLFLDSY